MYTQKQYEQMNGCLNHLQFILRRIGVTEFTVSEQKRNVNWEVIAEVDQALLDDFCKNMSEVYNAAADL